MENLGYLAVLLAFLLSVYATVAALAGKLRSNPFLEFSAQRAVLGAWLMTTAASGILLHAILTDNFSFNYVASRSNADLDLLYKIAAWWGGQEGSLLFWSWIAATYSFVAVYTGRRRHRNMISYVVVVMAATQAFFLGLVAFEANPFQVIMSGPQITAVPDGSGLNPLLQHPMMAIHPPMLYLGYVGFTVPFAFALASLITKQPGERWIHTTRVWTMITWLFQSIGVMLGARWAYVVLGWGGYWGWDPVENASLLPWLTGTAFLHSVMMQEKKGDDEDLEHHPDFVHVLPVHLRDDDDPRRAGQLGARIRAIEHRHVFRVVPDRRHRHHDLHDREQAGVPAQRGRP